jgi:hypothetical protein
MVLPRLRAGFQMKKTMITVCFTRTRLIVLNSLPLTSLTGLAFWNVRLTSRRKFKILISRPFIIWVLSIIACLWSWLIPMTKKTKMRGNRSIWLFERFWQNDEFDRPFNFSDPVIYSTILKWSPFIKYPVWRIAIFPEKKGNGHHSCLKDIILMIHAKCLVAHWDSKGHNAIVIHQKLVTRFHERYGHALQLRIGSDVSISIRISSNPEFTQANDRTALLTSKFFRS